MDEQTTAPLELADGSAPTSPDAFLAHLDSLGIAHQTFEHEPVFTVEESRRTRGELEGAHVKNLFLRNKKGEMWLLTCLEDRQIDLKRLAERLGAGRFSFGNAERLMKFLGVIPGAVTAFAVINDTGNKVRFVLDRALLDSSLINLHPLTNAMTTAIAPADLLTFLKAADHPPEILDLDEL